MGRFEEELAARRALESLGIEDRLSDVERKQLWNPKSVRTINGTGPDDSGNFNLPPADVSNLVPYTGATKNVSLGSETITAGNLSGTNTGDQTITLTGDVTGSGTGSFPTSIKSSVSLTGNPTATTQATGDSSTKVATTAFVTTAVANAVAGVNPAVAVQAATTQASDTSGLTYNNGASGVGATLTGVANTALTVDGYTFTSVGQRLLVKNDTQSPSGSRNGIYSVTQIQTSLVPIVLTRASDYNTPSDINNTGAIPVVNGTANGTTMWVVTSQVNTVGTDPLTYAEFSVNPATLVPYTGATGDLNMGNNTVYAAQFLPSGVTNIGGSTTPDVSSGNVFTCTNASPLTITNFINGSDGQQITITFKDGNTTVKNNSTILLSGGADFTPTTNTALTFVYSSSNTLWTQLGGSGGGTSAVTGSGSANSLAMWTSGSNLTNVPAWPIQLDVGCEII